MDSVVMANHMPLLERTAAMRWSCWPDDLMHGRCRRRWMSGDGTRSVVLRAREKIGVRGAASLALARVRESYLSKLSDSKGKRDSKSR